MLSTYVIVLFALIVASFGWSLGQLLEEKWIAEAVGRQKVEATHRHSLDWYFWHEDEWFWEEAENIQVKKVGDIDMQKAWRCAFFGWLPGTTYEEEMDSVEEEFYADFMMSLQIDEALL